MPKSSAKLIRSISIERVEDSDGDTSWLGEYSDTRDSEFSIDRWHSLTCGVNDPDKSEGDRLDARSQKLYDRPFFELDADKRAEMLEDIEDNPCDEECQRDSYGIWNHRHGYRYFNPGTVEKFDPSATWIPADVEDKRAYWYAAMRKNAKSEFDRMEAYNDDQWSFIGIRAVARITVNGVSQTISSGGLYGIESDVDDAYFAEVAGDELSQLRTQLHELGFSKRAIATACKDVEGL